MRFTWKLLLLVAIGVVMQASIRQHESDIDEAQFAARCLIGKLFGIENNDPEMLDAAIALRDRQIERVERRYAAAGQATTRPAGERAASVADELELSLAHPAAGASSGAAVGAAVGAGADELP